MIPPVITTDSGYCISLPTPVAYRSGNIPNNVVKAVIKTGLKRSRVASFMSVFSSTCGNFLRSSSMKLRRTIPFSMAMAKMAKKPMIAETDRYMPLITRATIPPISPKGTFSKISIAFERELNAVYKSNITKKIVIGMIIISF